MCMTFRTHGKVLVILTVLAIQAVLALEPAGQRVAGPAAVDPVVERIVNHWSEQAAKVQCLRAEVLEWERGISQLRGGMPFFMMGRGRGKALLVGDLVIINDDVELNKNSQLNVQSGKVILDQTRWRIDAAGDLVSQGGRQSTRLDNGMERIEYWKPGNNQPGRAFRGGSSPSADDVPQMELWNLLFRPSQSRILHPFTAPPVMELSTVPDLPKFVLAEEGGELLLPVKPDPRALAKVKLLTLAERLILTEEKQVLNGRNCICLQVLDTYANNTGTRLWVTPELDDRIAMLEQSLGNGGTRWTTIEYRQDAEYGWLPARWRTEEHSPEAAIQSDLPAEGVLPDDSAVSTPEPAGSSHISYSVDTRVLRLEVNPELDDAVWQFSIPEGTQIFEENPNGVMFW